MCILTKHNTHSYGPTNEEMRIFWNNLGHEVSETHFGIEPIDKAKVYSKTALESENKGLMAHIMYDLGIFPSVSQARKNGWDKPLEIGDFTVTKKKIKFNIID